ncbi:hypothetical protein G6F43_008827 [Rhizopus delemar]|nr:hypothetical protein G6F43_008827 [Rhizopus delemar]
MNAIKENRIANDMRVTCVISDLPDQVHSPPISTVTQARNLLNVQSLNAVVNFPQFLSTNKRYLTTATTQTSRYQKYIQQFKNKPGSYLTSFAILHELTAVAPFPVIYYALEASSVKIPFSDSFVEEGNKFVNKVRIHYGYEPLEADNQTMIHLVTTYCVVKALLPVRLAASAAMTPTFAEKLISPSVQWIRRLKK